MDWDERKERDENMFWKGEKIEVKDKTFKFVHKSNKKERKPTHASKSIFFALACELTFGSIRIKDINTNY